MKGKNSQSFDFDIDTMEKNFKLLYSPSFLFSFHVTSQLNRPLALFTFRMSDFGCARRVLVKKSCFGYVATLRSQQNTGIRTLIVNLTLFVTIYLIENAVNLLCCWLHQSKNW